MRLNLPCRVCGKIFTTNASRLKTGRGKYCSRECSDMAHRKREEQRCSVCGKVFYPLGQRTGRFCSRDCYGVAFRGENSPHWKGGPATRECKNCGSEFEIVLSPSVLEKGWGVYCSRQCQGEDQRGEKSPNWKGGLNPRGSLEYKDWRKAVYARDNWACQDCGSKGFNNLNAHHVFSYAQFPEHQLAVWNGITLCVDCHQKCHPNMHILSGKERNDSA